MQGIGHLPLACLVQTNVGHAHASPATLDWQENVWRLRDQQLLQFRRQFQIAEAIVLTGECGENAAADAEVRSAHPDMPVDDIKPLRDVLRESVAEPRFRAVLLVAFALMAVTLAAIGEYGLISYSVMQRTREIGIRVALGAGTRQVVLPILREGMTLAVAGVAIGLAGSFAASRLLARFLFGVGSTDPLTYFSVTLFLLAVALLASYIPSRRVLSIDPVTALRTD